MAQSDPKYPQPSKRRGRPRESEVAAQLGGSASFTPFPDGPTDADGLTLRQRRILEVIKETVDRRGYPPSIREMGDAVGLASSSSVAHQLKMLEAKGLLRRDRRRRTDPCGGKHRGRLRPAETVGGRGHHVPARGTWGLHDRGGDLRRRLG